MDTRFALFTEDGLDAVWYSPANANREVRDLRRMGCTVRQIIASGYGANLEDAFAEMDERVRDGKPLGKAWLKTMCVKHTIAILGVGDGLPVYSDAEGGQNLEAPGN